MNTPGSSLKCKSNGTNVPKNASKRVTGFLIEEGNDQIQYSSDSQHEHQVPDPVIIEAYGEGCFFHKSGLCPISKTYEREPEIGFVRRDL